MSRRLNAEIQRTQSKILCALAAFAFLVGGAMPAIEVERQMLPMLGSPNQGARFYNPNCHRPNRSCPVTARAPAAGRPSSTG
jgi:hypothetical protein